MEIKNDSHTQNNISLTMIISEERHTLRTLFEDLEPDDEGRKMIPSYYFDCLHIRSTYNPDLAYYMVKCDDYVRYGYTADELFDDIEKEYIESGYQPLNELFTFIERI